MTGNARRYREQQLAPTDLETLIDTPSPVGVVVSDVGKGRLAAEEAGGEKVAMGYLAKPDGPVSVEECLASVTFRRADRSEVSLAKALSRRGDGTGRGRSVIGIPGRDNSPPWSHRVFPLPNTGVRSNWSTNSSILKLTTRNPETRSDLGYIAN